MLAWVQEGGALRSRKASGPKRLEGLPAAARGADMRHAPPPSSPHLAAQPWQSEASGEGQASGQRRVRCPQTLAPVTQSTLHLHLPLGR